MNDIMAATLSLRSNFAIHHLRAARWAARSAYDFEQASDTAVFGSWFDDMMMVVPIAVVMAGAALEANANEIIKDILDGIAKITITDSGRTLLADLFDDRSGNAMDKYRRLALLLDREPKTGNAPWENARLLVNFRNCFLHFKSAWDDEKAIHEGKLVKALKTKIPVCAAYKGSFMFPYGFMNFECARWSVRTVLGFSAEFSAALGINDRFVGQNLDFTLP
jgi:hypothetical protein